MNSRRVLFVIFAALVLVFPSGEGFPVGRAEWKDFPEGENPLKPLKSNDKRLSDAAIGAKSRSKRSAADAVTDDGQHGGDVDYVLMEKLTNEYLLKNGGDLDRQLEEHEYDIITENYEKHIREEEEKKKEKDKATSSTLAAEGQTQRPSDVHTTKRTSDDGKSISTTPAFLLSSKSNTKQESSTNILTAFIVQNSTSSLAIKTPTEYPGKLFTTKSPSGGVASAKDGWSAMPATVGIPGNGRETLSWAGNSKGGHKVHVVVYFD